MLPKKASSQQCVFPRFTSEDPEECSQRTRRLTDNAWEKLMDEYKLEHPWLQKDHWLCTRHFSHATIIMPRTAARAHRRKCSAPDSDSDSDGQAGSISRSPRKIAFVREPILPPLIPLPSLPVARQPLSLRFSADHQLEPFTASCPECGAKHWLEERTKGSSMQ